MGAEVWSPVMPEGVGAASPLPGGAAIGWAVGLAVASTGCYATSAVLQEREAARPGPEGAARLLRLLSRPMWWVAVAATVAAAGLHVAALALGPLSTVQPLGVLTLVFALPLGARWAGRVVSRREWGAAGLVVIGLVAVLIVVPQRAPPVVVGLPTVVATAAVLGGVAAGLFGLAAVLPERVVAVGQAAGAAICFGLASGMARLALTGAAPFPVGAVVAVLGAATGLAMAQFAYRHGGLGAPLATLILLDPLVAVVLGVTVLHEPLRVTPGLIALGLAGLISTACGIWMLAQVPASGLRGEATDSSATPADG
jgi:drug/metabolite transporter (DMT)-like permease